MTSKFIPDIKDIDLTFVGMSYMPFDVPNGLHCIWGNGTCKTTGEQVSYECCAFTYDEARLACKFLILSDFGIVEDDFSLEEFRDWDLHRQQRYPSS